MQFWNYFYFLLSCRFPVLVHPAAHKILFFPSLSNSSTKHSSLWSVGSFKGNRQTILPFRVTNKSRSDFLDRFGSWSIETWHTIYLSSRDWTVSGAPEVIVQYSRVIPCLCWIARTLLVPLLIGFPAEAQSGCRPAQVDVDAHHAQIYEATAITDWLRLVDRMLAESCKV